MGDATKKRAKHGMTPNSTAPPRRTNLRGDGYGGGGGGNNGYSRAHVHAHGHGGGGNNGYSDDFSLSDDDESPIYHADGSVSVSVHGGSINGGLRHRRNHTRTSCGGLGPENELEHVQSHNYEPDESEIWRAYTAQQHFRNRGQWWTTGKKRALKRWSLTLGESYGDYGGGGDAGAASGANVAGDGAIPTTLAVMVAMVELVVIPAMLK